MYPTVYSCSFYVFDLEDDEYIKDYSSLYHFAAEYQDPITELHHILYRHSHSILLKIREKEEYQIF